MVHAGGRRRVGDVHSVSEDIEDELKVRGDDATPAGTSRERKGFPSRKTITGVIELTGRRPGAI